MPFDTLWARGGAADDTLLLNPLTMVADSAHVYVYDVAASRIVAFEAGTGRMSWSFGRRGSGPGEFRSVVVLAAAPEGGVVTLDRASRRIFRIDGRGQLTRQTAWTLPAPPGSLCPLADGSVVVSTGGVSGPPLVHLSDSGQQIGEWALPWADLDTVFPLARQAQLAPAGNGRDCMIAFTMGRGLGRLSADRVVYRTAYIEAVALPSIVESRIPGGRTYRFNRGVTYAGRSMAADDGTLAVLFTGTSEMKSRVIDHYDLATGDYLLSFTTPQELTSIARGGGRYYFLHTGDDFPSLTAVVPRGQTAETSRTP